MQMVFDVFGQIFGTLWAHKMRSFLTMFGIAWGVGSLLLLVGLGEGFRTGNKRNLSEFGENIMMLYPGRAPAVAGSMNSARYYRLTYQDYVDIRNESPHVKAITPVLTTDDVHAVSEFASASGQLTLTGQTAADPATIDASATPGGQFLYVQAGPGIVDEFAVGHGGALTPVGSVTVAGAVGGEGITAS